MNEKVPRCGRPKKRSKYGSVLCQRTGAKLPGGGYASRCREHLTDAEKSSYGLSATKTREP